MYQILDGKELARKIREELKLKVDKLKENGIVPKLAVILVGDDSASKVYVKNKSKACQDVGVEFEEILLDENTSMERLLEIIEKLNNREDINGILLQSPIPSNLDINEAFRKISPEKDVDGFFIDNCDVYYYAPRKDIFDGLTVILQYIMTLGKEVIINGGDTYVTEYKERYGTIDPIMTGVNQETVWSHIDFAKGTFNEQNREEREDFCGYLESCKADGMEVYLLEYTANRKLIRKIEKYCRKQGFHFYISDSLELE